VAVQELARFRKRTLPSHFLLNCAITCTASRGKISLHSTKVTPKVETIVSVVIGTYLAIAKAEKHSHTETLEERNYILPRHRAWGNVSEENFRQPYYNFFRMRYGVFRLTYKFNRIANEL